jgi:iron complex outermembrane receptor protein
MLKTRLSVRRALRVGLPAVLIAVAASATPAQQAATSGAEGTGQLETVITTEDLRREGINSPEQLISYLVSNGNGLDNLAGNADVVTGAQRGNNGASSANLRGQGSAARWCC